MYNQSKPKHQTVKTTSLFEKLYPKLPDQITPQQRDKFDNMLQVENQISRQIEDKGQNRQLKRIFSQIASQNLIQNKKIKKKSGERQLKILRKTNIATQQLPAIKKSPHIISDRPRQHFSQIYPTNTNKNNSIIILAQEEGMAKLIQTSQKTKQYEKINTKLEIASQMRKQILKYQFDQFRGWTLSMNDKDIKQLYALVVKDRNFIQGRQLKYKFLQQQQKQNQKVRQIKRQKQVERQIQRLRQIQELRRIEQRQTHELILRKKLLQEQKQRQRQRQRQRQKEKERQKQRQRQKKRQIQNLNLHQQYIQSLQQNRNSIERKLPKILNTKKIKNKKKQVQYVNLISSQSQMSSGIEIDDFKIQVQDYIPKFYKTKTKTKTISTPKPKINRFQRPLILGYTQYQQSSFNSQTQNNSSSQNAQFKAMYDQTQKQNNQKCKKIIEQSINYAQQNSYKKVSRIKQTHLNEDIYRGQLQVPVQNNRKFLFTALEDKLKMQEFKNKQIQAYK